MNAEKLITREHYVNLPTVRLKKLVLKDFKSVNYGEIVFNCGKKYIPYGTESDILGIYGQNGSGKTSVIEALSILKYAMSGKEIPYAYSSCIKVGKEKATVEYCFDLQYKNGIIRELTYIIDITAEEYSMEERRKLDKDLSQLVSFVSLPEDAKRFVIFSEKIILQSESSKKKQVIIDTSLGDVFGPDTKRKELIGTKKESVIEHRINKKNAMKNAHSFIFMDETLELIKQTSEYSMYYQVLLEMSLFAQKYLIVIDTVQSNILYGNYFLPIFTREDMVLIDERHSDVYDEDTFERLTEEVDKLSKVLNSIIPGLEVGMKELSKELLETGENGIRAIPVAYREGTEIPLYGESDGVRKIISELSVLICVYNQHSTTLAIDEFDAGIFEYLLGEILKIMQETGKGQLIFTSHNLRPLEVLDKKFICFTTTNPDNRYARLKNVGTCHNLRDIYFRELVMGENEDPLYNNTKQYKIISALKESEE